MQIAITIDDLAFVEADAVARPVNAELRALTPAMRRLEHAAGEPFIRQLHVQQPLGVGAAVVTAAGAVHADLMIHAVVATETEHVSRDGVRRATMSALQRAHDFGVGRLAIAPFGLGPGNLDLDDAAQTMVAALATHAEQRAQARPQRLDVTIVVENALELEAFQAAVARLWAKR